MAIILSRHQWVNPLCCLRSGRDSIQHQRAMLMACLRAGQHCHDQQGFVCGQKYCLLLWPLSCHDANFVVNFIFCICHHWKPKVCHDANFVIIGNTTYTSGCCYGNLWCRQGWQSWYRDNSQVLVGRSWHSLVSIMTVIRVDDFVVLGSIRGSQIAKFMGPTWGPPGSCWPQMGPILAPWTLLSEVDNF